MNQSLEDTSMQTFPAFVKLAETFSQQEMNTVPYENSWTPAQLIQHLLLSYGVVGLLDGKTEETNRDPMAFDGNLRGTFLNFETKLQSPEFIKPEFKEYDREQLLADLKKKTDAIMMATKREGLDRTCLDFTIPGSPPMTGLEWLWFMNYHTMRHTRQLERMDEAMHR